jgi:hypothetical protein
MESFDPDGFTFQHNVINVGSSRPDGGLEMLEYDVVWTALGDPDDREWNEGGPEKLAPTGNNEKMTAAVFPDTTASMEQLDTKIRNASDDRKERILLASHQQATLDGVERLMWAASRG